MERLAKSFCAPMRGGLAVAGDVDAAVALALQQQCGMLGVLLRTLCSQLQAHSTRGSLDGDDLQLMGEWRGDVQ